MTSIPYEEAPFQGSHWRLVTGATAGYISDGYTLGVVGIALAAAQSQLNLTPAWLGALGSSSLAGQFLGALLSGWAADRYRRRPIYAYNMIAFIALSLVQWAVGTANELLLIRFLLGLVLGTDYVVCKALLAECTPRLSRGRCPSLMGVAWAVGYSLAYIVGMWLEGTGPDAWGWILISSTVPAIISVPLRITAPESPLWLSLVGRHDQAQQVIEQCVGKGYGTPTALASQRVNLGELFSS